MTSDECLDGPCFQTKVNAHIDREIAVRPELIQIENAFRSPKERKLGTVPRGHFHEIAESDPKPNPDAMPLIPCQAAKPAIIVYGKRAGSTLTVCTDDHCQVHHPDAAAHQAEPAPIEAPTLPAESEEEAEARRQQQEQQRQEEEAERERREEEERLERERDAQEYKAEQNRRDGQRKTHAATFERILGNAPATFNAAQLRVLLRAIVNLDPYTFADDLAADIANENEQRGAEEVLLTTIDSTPDDKLTRCALRLALSGHRAIPRKGEFDFLTEAEAVFLSQPKPVRKPENRKAKPVLVKTATKKGATVKKKAAAYPNGGSLKGLPPDSLPYCQRLSHSEHRSRRAVFRRSAGDTRSRGHALRAAGPVPSLHPPFSLQATAAPERRAREGGSSFSTFPSG